MSDYVEIVTRVRITDDDLDTLAITAGYGGITYWAGDATRDEKDAAIEAEPDTFMVFRDNEEGKVVAITKAQARAAFVDLARPDQPHVNRTIHGYFQQALQQGTDEDGLEMGAIDADAADVWVQVAAFGKVVYG